MKGAPTSLLCRNDRLPLSNGRLHVRFVDKPWIGTGIHVLYVGWSLYDGQQNCWVSTNRSFSLLEEGALAPCPPVSTIKPLTRNHEMTLPGSARNSTPWVRADNSLQKGGVQWTVFFGRAELGLRGTPVSSFRVVPAGANPSPSTSLSSRTHGQ